MSRLKPFTRALTAPVTATVQYGSTCMTNCQLDPMVTSRSCFGMCRTNGRLTTYNIAVEFCDNCILLFRLLSAEGHIRTSSRDWSTHPLSVMSDTLQR